MFDGFGVSFAPTAENAMEGNRQGQLEGLPAAIKILSLHMPRFVGARGIAPDELLNGRGANGVDPFASSVMQSLLQSLTSGAAPAPVITPGADRPSLDPVIEAPPSTPQTPPAPAPEPRRRVPRVPGVPGGIGRPDMR